MVLWIDLIPLLKNWKKHWTVSTMLFIPLIQSLRDDEYRWGKEWEGQSVWSKSSGHSWGVTILFNSSIRYDNLDIVKDPNGRYIRLKVKCKDLVYNIVNIYAHNDHKHLINSYDLEETWRK